MLGSLADLHWKLGNSGSAFADWHAALALQPKEALSTAIQARARESLMALVHGERDTSASSVNLLCERRQERAAVMVAQPLLELVAGELALGLDDGAFAVCPAGLDRV